LQAGLLPADATIANHESAIVNDSLITDRKSPLKTI
jgi:hypothetical protein